MPEIFNTILTLQGFTLSTYLIGMACAFVCGIVVAFAATFRSRSSKSFFLTLILLPAVVQTVITMVNGNVGTGIAVAGAFSLVRFRSVPGKAKDIAAIFLTMTAGLTCASGYVAIAILFSIIASAVMILITLIPVRTEREYDLRITVPEALNYTEIFDDIFQKYTKSCRIASVRTTNMGSLYRIDYKLEMKNSAQTREMIDELRCRNGNLEVRIKFAEERSEEL